jgi:hypothetical protein
MELNIDEKNDLKITSRDLIFIKEIPTNKDFK